MWTNDGNENLKEPLELQFMAQLKQLKSAEYFNCLGNMITNDARCTRDIKSGLSWQKQHSTGRRLFTCKLDLNLKKKLVKCYNCSIALYGAET